MGECLIPHALWSSIVYLDKNTTFGTPLSCKNAGNAPEHAKKVVSDSAGLVDFAIGLVNFVLNLPNGQVKFFEEIKLQKNCKINSAHEMFLGLVEMTFGLVYASFSLPEWQSLKMTFFAPWHPMMMAILGRMWKCAGLGHSRQAILAIFGINLRKLSGFHFLEAGWRGMHGSERKWAKFRRHCAAARFQICKPCCFIVY